MATVPSWARFARAVSLLLLPLAAGVLLAAEQSYDYDPLGRLVRSTAGGNSVEYRYDAAGNLLEVTGNLPVTAPTVSTVTPDFVRRGQIAQITLNGDGLAYSSITTPSSAFTVSAVSASSATLAFDLAVAEDAPLGANTFTTSNSAGSANFMLTVNPKLPVLSVAPLPLAVAPDSIPRSFSITLSNADTVSHTVNFATSNSTIATVSPSSVIIAPGQTSVLASVTGISGGNTVLSLTSPTLQTVQVPVFVTADFAGISTSHAPLVGVVLEKTPEPEQQTVQLGTHADVGVVVGGHIRGIAPQSVPQGSSAALTLFGKGLETATAVSLYPVDGVTLGNLSVSQDGLSATLPVTIAPDAPPTLRQLVLIDGAGNRFPAARADSDRFLVAYPAPIVESITPIYSTAGSISTVILRGRNLQQGKVQLSPGTGIQVDGSPAINASGTEMTFKLSIDSFNSLGEHLIAVFTPGGTSASVKGPENTFTVVASIDEVVTPISAPQVGVFLQTDSLPAGQDFGLQASSVGIAIGPVVTGVLPRAGVIGETVALSLLGQELDGVTALSFSPAEGITVNSLTPSGDSKTIDASVTIAADASKSIRTIKAWAGTTAIPFSDIRQSQFQVTAPLPRVDSVTPINLAVGSGPVTLTVRGVNFKDASLVSILPATGITVGQPPAVNEDSTEITVNVTVDPAAAPGQRVVAVTTPAGVTEEATTPANTLHIVSTLGDVVAPIQAPALGVVKLADASSVIGSLLSLDVGVVLQTEPPPPTIQDLLLGSTPLGVVVGPVATDLQATALRPGISGTLTVSGVGLHAVSLVSVSPETGISLGMPTHQPDGMALSIPITLAADAPAGIRELKLSDGSVAVPFTQASGANFVVAPGEPRIDSITPILARQGDTVALTVRGAHLNHATVVIEPVAGLVLGSGPAISADGTELTVGLHIPAEAALGPRIIRVQTPGGITSDQAEPTNTFTVFPP